MARYQHLPIWRTAMDLAPGLEQAVTGFPRAHRDALGADLRCSAQVILGGVMRSARARELRKVEPTLKVQLAQARELGVFASFQHLAGVGLVQVGSSYWLLRRDSVRPVARWTPQHARAWAVTARADGLGFCVLRLCGWQRDGRRERQLVAVYRPLACPAGPDRAPYPLNLKQGVMA